MSSHDLEWLDAMHLASASLPIGGFAYSQGLEQARQTGAVRDVETALCWIEGYLSLILARQEMPWWFAIYGASRDGDWVAVRSATLTLQAMRETAEARLESRQMGHALTRLYDQWLGSGSARSSIPLAVFEDLKGDYCAAHAVLCAAKPIAAIPAMTAWLWAWLDSQVLAAVKLVPLGQRDGQAILHRLKGKIPDVVDLAIRTPLADAGSAPFGLMMASARHETQYARLFRS